MMTGMLFYAPMLFWLQLRALPCDHSRKALVIYGILMGCVSTAGLLLQQVLLFQFFLLLLSLLYLLFYAAEYTLLPVTAAAELILFLISACAVYFLQLHDQALFFSIIYITLLYACIQKIRYHASPTELCLFLALGILCAVFTEAYHTPCACIGLLLVILLLDIRQRQLHKTFQRHEQDFQNEVVAHHYDEVKAVYLNMRGWRHDYHNHIQTLKAYFSLQRYAQMEEYLNELEQDLLQVDQLVKSGNLLVDAILNSKLTLAKEHHIALTCKAAVPPQLCISDIDLCVLLGNLLDNAIEACRKIDEAQRFLRIYIDIVHSQFYVSIMNAASQDIDFQETQYISKKRGDHGHGMKRVKLVADKYEGYLNLKNEQGVFVSELMLPMSETPVDA